MLAAVAGLLATACDGLFEEASAPFETVIPERPITAPLKSATASFGNATVDGIIDNSSKTITFQFEMENVDLTEIKVHLELISRATASTGFFTDSTLNLTEPYSFAVNNRETDVIYTIFAKLPSFVEVDKETLSVLYGRAGDGPIQTDNGYGVKFTQKELFDGQWMSGYQRFTEVAYHYFGWTANATAKWFTFQCETPFKMSKIKFYPYWGFRQYDPAQFEIWAFVGNELPAATPADWKTNGLWKKIAEVDMGDMYEKIKELLKDTSNVGDPQFDPCVNGFEFSLTDFIAASEIPSAKYYRFAQVNNYYGYLKAESGDTNWNARVGGCTISELRIWKFSEDAE